MYMYIVCVNMQVPGCHSGLGLGLCVLITGRNSLLLRYKSVLTCGRSAMCNRPIGVNKGVEFIHRVATDGVSMSSLRMYKSTLSPSYGPAVK